MRRALTPQPGQRPAGAVERIGRGQRHARNGAERARMFGLRAAAQIVVALRRIGADHQQIGRRRDALMPGAGGQHRDVAGLDLELLAAARRRSARAPGRPRCRALRGSANGNARTGKCRCATCRGPSRSSRTSSRSPPPGLSRAPHRSRRDRPGTAGDCSAPRRRRRTGMSAVQACRSWLRFGHQRRSRRNRFSGKSTSRVSRQARDDLGEMTCKVRLERLSCK